MSARRYLHVGLPKALSTALQRDFFAAHPALRHLGVGCGSNVDYRDADLELAVEGHLMFCKELRWREREAAVRRTFARHFAAADADPRIRAVGISNESLCFSSFPGHLDSPVKARRLRALFGPDAEVILVLRAQPDLLRSLHGEAVRNGYAGTFAEFVAWHWLYQDRSCLWDFLYDRLHDLWAGLFGPEHVHVVLLEEHRDGTALVRGEDGVATIVAALCRILDVPCLPLAIGRHNDALAPAARAAKARLNAGRPHDLGRPLFDGAPNLHRLRQYFARDLAWDASAWLHEDVRRKRALIAEAEVEAAAEVAAGGAADRDVADRCPEEIWRRLEPLFAAANAALEARLGRPLPDAYRRLERP